MVPRASLVKHGPGPKHSLFCSTETQTPEFDPGQQEFAPIEEEPEEEEGEEEAQGSRSPENSSRNRGDSGSTAPEGLTSGDSCVGRESLIKHIKTPTLETYFSCCVCGKSYIYKHNLQRHLRTHSDLTHAHRGSFCCSECGRTFVHRHNLQRHVQRHRGSPQTYMKTQTAGRPFKCFHCGKTFTLLGFLQRHMVVHPQVKPFRCGVCRKRFFWRFQLKDHRCQGAKGPARVSRGQDESVHAEDWRNIRRHPSGFTYQRSKKAPEAEEKPYSDHDPEPGDDRRRLQHSETVQSSGEDRLSPPTQSGTDENVSNPISAPEHSISRHACDHLGHRPLNVYVNSVGFVQSESSGPQTSSKPLLHCSICQMGFGDRETLFQHMGVHSRQTQFRCFVCRKEFTWRRHLTKHMEVHAKTFDCWDVNGGGQWPLVEPSSEADRKPAPGAAGKKTFDFSESDSDDSDFWKESRKKNRVKEEETPSEAGADGALWSLTSSRNQSGLVETSGSRETGGSLGDSPCDSGRWGRQGAGPVNVKKEEEEVDVTAVHVKTEDAGSDDSDFWSDSRKPERGRDEERPDDDPGDDPGSRSSSKPYICCQCGQGFSYLDVLESHMKLHTAKASYWCPVCGKQCIDAAKVRIHLRTHTGETPFSCSTCGKKFKYKWTLKRHLEIHNSEKRYHCSVCDQRFAWSTELKYHQCLGERSPHKGALNGSSDVCEALTH